MSDPSVEPQPPESTEHRDTEPLSQLVSSTTPQEPNSEDNLELQDGCDSTTEVNEIETEETTTSEDDAENENSNESGLKTSRELKSILALSKEAKLDTNLTNRRKTLETKAKDTPTPSPSLKKMKVTSFPVTAESELENFVEEKKPVKKRTEGASESDSCRRKSAEQSVGDFVMSKKPNKDVFCWRCHHDSVQIACETCPRAYHLKCLKQSITDMEHWPCPECVAILKAENTQTRSKAMKSMTLEHLCSLLKYAVKRMIQCNGSEPFVHPVDEKQFPEYRSYIVQPMTLTMLQNNIRNNLYGSTQAFEADAKWILHNSIIFNSYQSKLTTAAKSIVKICKQEMAEIENCSSCYLNANTKKHTWFVEVCPKPHLLVWAKLKGFPYWPAKVMSISSSGMADVRFFGAHDKAWVSVKDCFLYSTKDPNSGKQKRNDIAECVKELELYVDNLRAIYGRVHFAPFKTLLDGDNQLKQLQSFLPSYRGEGKEVKKLIVNYAKDDSATEQNNSNSEKKSGGSELNKAASDDGDDEDDGESDESCDSEENDEEENDKDSVKSKNGKQSNEDEDEEESKEESKEASMTRIDYGESPVPEKKIVKPIKTIIIRKRYSSDNVFEYTKKFARRDPHKDENKRISLDNHIKSKTKTKDGGKIKISDELIKKLEDPVPEKPKKAIEKEDTTEAKPVEKPDTENTENEAQDNVNVDKSEDKVPEAVAVEEAQEMEVDKELKENIVNIIHSSLVAAPKKTDEEVNNKKRKIDDVIEDEDKTESAAVVESDNSFPPNKMVKLVPIEDILQKKNDVVAEAPLPALAPVSTNTNKPPDLIVLKEVRVVKEANKTEDAKNVKVKNEIESDEDNDLQYMEAKRQYLSALNISEKQKIPSKPKTHEIRTRSKTEEKKIKNSDGSKEIFIKSLTKLQTPKHKARKSFPTPNYSSKKPVVARKIIPRPDGGGEEFQLVNATTLQPLKNQSNSVMILPKLHYNKPIPVTRDLSSPPVLTMLPQKKQADASQNFIPQNEDSVETASASKSATATVTIGSSGIILNNLLAGGTATSSATPVIDLENPNTQTETDLGVLKEILPENVAKGVSEILCQPPPKLKPKPVGLLNSVVENGVPSTAGPVASRIHSMAQKLSDCFRGLLVETVNDLGKSDNPEATISSLKLEIEELNHKHSIELAEIRRNVSIVLKDIQKSVVEERERIVNETKANCEVEMAKRVEEAKSKQWCANCSKEAQFYCCWNTSYCDYPCQQKHWLKHMSKCTQTANNQSTPATSTPVRTPGQQIVLTPTSAPKFGNLFTKPQKVYLKRANAPFKQSPGGHITLVESTPGNYELLGTGPIAVNGKILASTSVIEKIKGSSIVTVQAPSAANNTQLTTSASPKVINSPKPSEH